MCKSTLEVYTSPTKTQAPNPCNCGQTPQMMVVYPAEITNGYIGFFEECACGQKTRRYASPLGGRKAWNAGERILTDGKSKPTESNTSNCISVAAS